MQPGRTTALFAALTTFEGYCAMVHRMVPCVKSNCACTVLAGTWQRVLASCGSGVKLRGRQRLAWVKPRTGDPCAVWWPVLAWSLPGKERPTKATVALVLVSHPPPPIHRHHLAVAPVAHLQTALWSPLSLLTLIEATLGICPLISPVIP